MLVIDEKKFIVKGTTAMRVFALVVVHNRHNPEMPTSRHLKSGDSIFWHYPPPPAEYQWSTPPPPHKHNSIQSLIGLGPYMKSYMRYRTITISVYDCNREIIYSLSLSTCENATETELWLKENSNFGRKWDKFQIKAQKSSELDFIREICWPV